MRMLKIIVSIIMKIATSSILKVNKIIFQDPDAPWEKPQLPPIKVTNNNHPQVSGNLINSR